MRTQLQEWLTCSFEEVPISHLCYDLLLWTWLIYLAGGTQKQPFILLSSFLERAIIFSPELDFFFFFQEENQSQVFINETLSFNLWFLLDSNVSVSRRKDCKDV